MEILRVQNITISPDSIRSAIQALDRAIEVHMKMRGHFEEILTLQGAGRRGRGRPPGARPGRPAGARQGEPGLPGARRRGRRGGRTLRQAIVEVLAAHSGVMKPRELRDAILDSGYRTGAKAQSFYTSVFTTAKKEPGVVKTKAGFQLKAGYTPAAGEKPAKGPRGRKRRGRGGRRRAGKAAAAATATA